MKGPTVRELRESEVATRGAALAEFERRFTYPLGAEHFRIDHGRDYLAFFRRLGEPHVFVAETEEGIVGVLVAVLRDLGGRSVWYLCDLKATEAAVRRGGVARPLFAEWQRTLAPSDPFFGVSMDRATGANAFVRAVLTRGGVGAVGTTPLEIFALDFDEWTAVETMLREGLGPFGLRDNAGVKDLVLVGREARLDILHVVRGAHAEQGAVAARPGALHMWCLAVSDPLALALHGRGVRPRATATILHRGMADFDWRRLSTADI